MPALVFSTSLYMDLDELDMMRAATAGGAVSPVTSYLSIEPGVRPSTDGFGPENSGLGGLGMSGIGSGGGGVTDYDKVTPSGEPDYAGILQGLASEAAGKCATEGMEVAAGFTAKVETTYREIVDVEVQVEGSDQARQCVEDAIWSVDLPDVFGPQRLQSTVTLG